MLGGRPRLADGNDAGGPQVAVRAPVRAGTPCCRLPPGTGPPAPTARRLPRPLHPAPAGRTRDEGEAGHPRLHARVHQPHVGGAAHLPAGRRAGGWRASGQHGRAGVRGSVQRAAGWAGRRAGGQAGRHAGKELKAPPPQPLRAASGPPGRLRALHISQVVGAKGAQRGHGPSSLVKHCGAPSQPPNLAPCT